MRMQFIADNPYGEFVAGDVLDLYIDDTAIIAPSSIQTAAISVKLNGSPLSATATLIHPLDSRVIVVNNFGVTFCYAGYFVLPYMNQVYHYGAYSASSHGTCEIVPVVCNLTVIGTPQVIAATGSMDANGQITVNATSSNAIEYKIDTSLLYTEFIYGDGTGQSSNVFTGLLPGSYRILLVDEKNCKANVSVVVPVDNSFGVKYRLEYDDLNGWLTRIDITKSQYSGAVNEICAGPVPFELQMRGEGTTNKFDPMPGSQGNLSALSETDLQFLELYTNDPNLFRLNYYKNFGSGLELKWVGKILPQLHQEEYKAPPYYVSVVASDGLPELSQFYLVQSDGEKFYGTVSLIKLVAYCLSVLRLDLNIRCGINLYAVEGPPSLFETTYAMATTDSDDPFDQAYVDYECFYLAEELPTLDFVLRSVLEPFGARIVQWENKWNILRVEELVDDFDYREFDKNGDYVSNGTYAPVYDVDFPSNTDDLVLVNANHNLEIRPGYGNVKVLYKLGLKPNILRNGDFRLKSEYSTLFGRYVFSLNKDGFLLVNAGYPISEGIEYIDENNIAYTLKSGADTTGEAYVKTDTYTIKMGSNNQLKIGVRCKMHVSAVLVGNAVYTTHVPYTKLRIMVKYGSLYLQSNGTWTSIENILTFFFTEFDKYLDFEIIANQPTTGTPTGGMDFDVRVYQAYPFHAQFTSLTDLKAFDTYTGGNQVAATGYRTEVLNDGTFDSLDYYELEENTDTADGFYIVRPDDYNGGTNPRQWIFKSTSWFNYLDGTTDYTFSVDKIYVKFLTDGKDPIDTITRNLLAEPNNNESLDKPLIIGSYSTLVVTNVTFGISLGVFLSGTSSGSVNIITTNILSADTIYTGYLRNSDGNGFEFFKRDGVAEADKLHGILLRTVSEQYKNPWRLLRGGFKTQTSFFGLLNTLREVNDNNRIYLPSGLSLDDKACIYTGEFLELSNSVAASGSDGSGSAPYSSGFSIGFGSSAFN